MRCATTACLLLLGLLAGPASAQTPPASSGTGGAAPAPMTVLVCVPVGSTGTASPNCPTDKNGNPQAVSVVNGYVLTADDYMAFQLASSPFDADNARNMFVIGLSAVCASFFMGWIVSVFARGASML